MPRLEQGDVQVQVVLGVIGGFRDRANGLAHLQAEIPERIKDGLHERLRRGGMPGNQHQQIDVAERTEFGTPVAARGDKADRGGGSGLQEKSVEKDIDRIGAELRDLAAEDASAMGRQLDFARFSQEHLGPRHELALQRRLAGQTVL